MESQNMETGIIKFMEQNHQSKLDFITKLYQSWKELLDHLEININIRQKLDWWFQKCYKERESTRYQTLFEEFLKAESKLPDDFLLKQELGEIRRLSNTEWVQKAIDCVRSEKELMQRHDEMHRQTIDHKHILEMESNCKKVRDLHKEIEVYLGRTQTVLNSLTETEMVKEEKENQLCDLKEVIKRKKDTNGKILNQHQLESTLETCQNNIRKLAKDLEEYKQILKKKFCELTDHLQVLVPNLLHEVNTWKRQYTLKYAELGPTPSLESIETWCADIGLIIEELHTTRLPKWQELLPGLEESKLRQITEPVVVVIKDLHRTLIAGSFLVTDQDDFIVKTDKKHFPKIHVRILALDKVKLTGKKINAYFVREEDFNTCYDNGNFDLTKLDVLSHEMNQKCLTVCTDKKSSHKFEVTFDKLAFKRQFNRIAQDKKPFVHEEKYRVVFHTNIEDLDLIALSLPMVVTTGANQGCCALASVMWQCFSTDVFEIPIQNRLVLPWSDIAAMLQAKFSKLSDVRKLSPENINHLKRRLLGSDQLPDDTEVSLNQFCFDKLNRSDNPELQHPFSFWKWFLANYNLLDKYLNQYWEDNLIGGFLSKDDVEQMFKRGRIVNKKGTFVLRFSDNHINDSQGVHSVFGYLTAMVTTPCDDDGEKNYKVHSTEVADHKKLTDKNLANILKESLGKGGKCGQIYKWLFPGDRSREEYFDKYCKEGTVVSGYRGKVDAFIVDLEQDMFALKISTGKHRRSSIDSGFGAMSPQSVGVGKRVKSSTETHPTIVNLLSNSSSIAGSPSHYSMISSPHPSPTYSPYAHEASMSPGMPQGQYEPLSPAPPQSQLPVMVQNGFGVGTGDHGNGYETISADDLKRMGSNVSKARQQQQHPKQQQPQSAYTENNLTPPNSGIIDQTENLPQLPPGMRVVVESNPPQDYQTCSGFTANFPNGHQLQSMNGGFSNQGNEVIVTSSPNGAFQCDYVSQLVGQIQSSPESVSQVLSVLLSKFSSEELIGIQESISSTQASPAHPMVEMDNTPMDFVGQEFMFSTNDFEAVRQVDSGTIDLHLLLPDDQETM